MSCPNCGGTLLGDGITTVVHCEFTDPDGIEPDANPVYCEDPHMPEFQISIDHTIDFEVFCGTCGAGLCSQSDTRYSRGRQTPQVTVDVCDKCVKNATEPLEGKISLLEEQIAELQNKLESL